MPTPTIDKPSLTPEQRLHFAGGCLDTARHDLVVAAKYLDGTPAHRFVMEALCDLDTARSTLVDEHS